AEDGIRDRNVTGVQTCALPICALRLIDGLRDVEIELFPGRHPDVETIAGYRFLDLVCVGVENVGGALKRRIAAGHRRHLHDVTRSEARRVGRAARALASATSWS